MELRLGLGFQESLRHGYGLGLGLERRLTLGLGLGLELELEHGLEACWVWVSAGVGDRAIVGAGVGKGDWAGFENMALGRDGARAGIEAETGLGLRLWPGLG